MRVCLTSAEFGRALDVIDAAHSAADLNSLGAVLADTITSSIGLDVVLFADVRADREHRFRSVPGTFPAGIPLAEADLIHAYWSKCPVAAHSMPGGIGTPMRWTDLISTREHRSVPHHTEVWGPLGGRNAIGFTLPLQPDRALCFALLRSGRDFPDHAVAILSAMRPKLVRRARYLASGGQNIADPAEPAGSDAARDAIQRLTSREREVLALVARGLTSAQIGGQLRVAARTVDKHVEHLLAKLGVPCRAAAVAAYTDAVSRVRRDRTECRAGITPGCREAGPLTESARR